MTMQPTSDNDSRYRVMLRLLLEQRKLSSPEEIMLAAAAAIGKSLRVDRVGFFDVNEAKTLVLYPSWSDRGLPPLGGELPIDSLWPLDAVGPRAAETIAIADSARHPASPPPLFTAAGVRSMIGTPIFRDGYWLAGLLVTHGEVRDWTEDEQLFVSEMADLAWDAVERARAQQALRESEARAYRILASIGDAVIVTDANGLISRMNPVAEVLTGWPLSEAAGRPLGEVFRIINETTRERAESPAEKVKRHGTVVGLANHTLLISREGKEIPIDDSGAPIRDERGTLTGMVLVFRDISTRRAAEHERDRSAALLQEMLDASTDAVAKMDREWTITFLNRKAADLLAPSGEVLGRNHWECFPASAFEGSPWLKYYYLAMDQKVASIFEEYYPEPLDIWMQIAVEPISDGIVVYFRDISDQHRAAEALRMSEERLRLALSSAEGVGIWDWDVAMDRVHADPSFARLYGLDVDRIEGGLPISTVTRNLNQKDRAGVLQAISEALETGDEFNQEYRLDQPDGSVRWVSAVGRCTYTADGSPKRFSGISLDITARRSTDEALRANEERLRIAAEAARLGTWEIDPASGRMSCSQMCRANFGRSSEQTLQYDDLVSAIQAEDREVFSEAIRRVAEDGTPFRGEYRVIWPDGSLHWILASGQALEDLPSKSKSIVGITIEVTERHQAAEALMQSEKLAAVGRLAASIAHEINNPLESVTNLFYLARNSRDLDELQGYLEIADRELQRVSVISNQTLRFYRQSSRPREVTYEDLIDSVLSVSQGRIVNAQVKLEQRNRADQAILCFDGEIRQVLNNLVGNAIDAMQHGGRLLMRSRVGTHWPTARKGLVITVADTGAGMNPGTLKKAFEPFFTTKGLSGTGLGLWVSEEIIARHKGAIRVRSRQGGERHGTVITVYLPFDAVVRER